MIKITPTFFWSWRPSMHRIGMGVVIYVPGLRIQVGDHNPPCRVCGSRDRILMWRDDNPGSTICPDCCEHPDYDYDRCDRRRFCVECGDDPPYDWGGYDCDDAVSISFGSFRDPSDPIGTPISELSGRPGHDGYEKFVKIAKSWGYD